MNTPSATLYRSSKDRMVGGVIAAFAERLGLDVPLSRFAFAVLAITLPHLIVAYIAALLIIPEEGKAPWLMQNDPAYAPQQEAAGGEGEEHA